MASNVLEAEEVDGGAPQPVEPWWNRVLRLVGWLLVTAGVIVALFIVYLMVWTGRVTQVAQDTMLAEWDEQADSWGLDEFSLDDDGAAEFPTIPLTGEVASDDGPATPAVGSAYSLIWFERDGQRIVNDDILSVVEGVTLDHLMSGPGHYPETEDAGEAGNFAVSGHRTTYSGPFYNMDRLTAGDEVHVVDRDGRHFVYEVQRLEVVSPSDVWVLDDDPLGLGGDHWMTLTTCHPRFSAAQRLVAFATLRTES